MVLKIDEIAERVLTLGETPNHQFSVYLKTAEIKETKEVSDGKKAVKEILESFKVIIFQQLLKVKMNRVHILITKRQPAK